MNELFYITSIKLWRPVSRPLWQRWRATRYRVFIPGSKGLIYLSFCGQGIIESHRGYSHSLKDLSLG